MSVTLRQIEAFRAVVSTGGFSRAADRLGCSQPALSQIVRDLEGVLGARLFNRTTRRIELTAAGEAFSHSALVGLDVIERAVRDVADIGALRQGTVRVAAPPFLAAHALPRAMAVLRAQHPGLRLAIADVSTESIVARVLSGQADLGIGTFAAAQENGFEQMSVLSDRLMVFAQKDDPAETLTWAALPEAPLILLVPESGIRARVEAGFGLAGVPFEVAHEVRQIETALALAEEGFGRAVLPAYASVGIAQRAIRAAHLAAPEMEREITLINARGRSLSPAAATARTVICNTLRAIADRRP